MFSSEIQYKGAHTRGSSVFPRKQQLYIIRGSVGSLRHVSRARNMIFRHNHENIANTA